MNYFPSINTNPTGVHDVFHVSQLRKCEMDPSASKKGEPDPTHIIDYRGIDLQEDVTIQDQPVQVLERQERVLRNQVIPLDKVSWSHHGVEEATWEHEDLIRSQFPHLFSSSGII